LTSRTAETDEAPRTRAIDGAIAALHDGGVSRFTPDVVAERAGIDADEVRAAFSTERALLAATVEWWTQAIAVPLVPLTAEKSAVPFMERERSASGGVGWRTAPHPHAIRGVECHRPVRA